MLSRVLAIAAISLLVGALGACHDQGVPDGDTAPAARPCPEREPVRVLSPAETSPETDREALITIHNATTGRFWGDTEVWLSPRPIGEWPEVTVDDDGRVVELDIKSRYGVGGAWPRSWETSRSCGRSRLSARPRTAPVRE